MSCWFFCSCCCSLLLSWWNFCVAAIFHILPGMNRYWLSVRFRYTSPPKFAVICTLAGSVCHIVTLVDCHCDLIVIDTRVSPEPALTDVIGKSFPWDWLLSVKCRSECMKPVQQAWSYHCLWVTAGSWSLQALRHESDCGPLIHIFANCNIDLIYGRCE